MSRKNDSPNPRVISVPGRLIPGELGLGDAVKKLTSAVGVSPCSACQKRAEALNRWVTLRATARPK